MTKMLPQKSISPEVKQNFRFSLNVCTQINNYTRVAILFLDIFHWRLSIKSCCPEHVCGILLIDDQDRDQCLSGMILICTGPEADESRIAFLSRGGSSVPRSQCAPEKKTPDHLVQQVANFDYHEININGAKNDGEFMSKIIRVCVGEEFNFARVFNVELSTRKVGVLVVHRIEPDRDTNSAQNASVDPHSFLSWFVVVRLKFSPPLLSISVPRNGVPTMG